MSSKKAGFTLAELLVTLAISLILVGSALPSLSTLQRDLEFESFAHDLKGHLFLAKRLAARERGSAWLELGAGAGAGMGEGAGDFLRTVVARSGEAPRVVAQSAVPRRRALGIYNRLPVGPLPHPTQDRDLDRAWSSTHGDRVVFGPVGSSSATLVFSDLERRAVCAVIAGNTGRFRIYIRRGNAWHILY